VGIDLHRQPVLVWMTEAACQLGMSRIANRAAELHRQIARQGKSLGPHVIHLAMLRV
jgi:hypothetical protein